MSQISKLFYTYQDLIYKLLLVIASATLIIYFFPKSGKFQFDVQKGIPWASENLYADEDFAILKSENAIEEEREQIRNTAFLYFTYDDAIHRRVLQHYIEKSQGAFEDSLITTPYRIALIDFAQTVLEELYTHGVINEKLSFPAERLAYVTKNGIASQLRFSQIVTVDEVPDYLESKISNSDYVQEKTRLLALLYDVVLPNVTYDAALTGKGIQEELDQLSLTSGKVTKGSRIIARGELVEGEALQKLLSLKAKYETQNFNVVYSNNTKVTFIFFNIVLMVLLTVAVVKYQPDYIYAVPLCILPLILKAFFDPRLGLFTLVITVLLLGFIVPNNFEYFFLQIIAGIVTILTVSELYKRANLFISVGQITLVYMVAYFAFNIIHEGGVGTLEFENFGHFILAGLATLFVQPLIYIYEKVFGLVSDVSLLELSDTNSKVLKELADKAPGTFHHSLNVANLCEAAANEIGANAMLVRVGALYHDIGKMNNPSDFTENQANAINIHDDLSPKESADIIIGHVIDGVELARKYNLPDRIMDFIRTHHGTSLVRYFYQKAKDRDEEVTESDYRYPGPLPFSKETAILMMADSVEAASKSLKNPTSILIDTFVDKIITQQKDDNQFVNADITFKEIELIKKVLKKKLNNIYHLRIEYPE